MRVGGEEWKRMWKGPREIKVSLVNSCHRDEGEKEEIEKKEIEKEEEIEKKKR